MEGLKDYISLINDKVEKSLTSVGIKHILAFGIAENVVSKNQSFPVFFRGEDGTFAGFDDKMQVIIYHKTNSVQVAVPQQTYGEGNNILINRYAAIMYVFFDTLSTGFQKDEMFTFLQSIIPEHMKGEKYSYIRTSITNAILNTQQVFSSEYRGVRYPLKPEQSLISISYTLEGKFKKGCFNCCPEETNKILNV